MLDNNKLKLIQSILKDTQNQVEKAQNLLSSVLGNETSIGNEEIGNINNSLVDLPDAKYSSEDNTKIIEGIFDGQNMKGKDGSSYSVPANYASKSKLVAGDKMKLTITPEGRFVYKQIGPVERTSFVGPLTYENGQYKVLANGKSYNIILASVTYFRTEVGDEVSILVPTDNQGVEWATLDAVIPKIK